jgi:hydrophobe/amphiphile efflux-1 (HAE1) family protein
MLPARRPFAVISHFFIDRPIFATVLSIVIVLAGLVAAFQLPVAQYPEVTPPTVQVTASYPGANAQVVVDTVAAPIEAQVSGVEGMIYMSSRSTNDGTYTLTVTFNQDMDSNMAQVLVQNRVSLALPVIPDLVQRQGINTQKMSPDTLMIVNLISPNGDYNDLFLSNYATIEIRDELGRLPGVADVSYLGQRDYSMRVWLDPQKLAALNVTAGDVVLAIAQQNLQVAAGQIGQQPVPRSQQFQLTINTLGRLTDPSQFADIIIKSGTTAVSTGQGTATAARGATATSAASPAALTAQNSQTLPPSQATAIVRLRDVARVEMGAQQYGQTSTLDGKPSVALTIFQLPGSNALQTARGVYRKMEELSRRFPQGVAHQIVYDTTPFVRESVVEVFYTLRDAVILVAVVVLVFLQNWRATLIPLVAVPVAIIGTFAVMAALGYSLNNLSLFGLVLAIGIVVDDAIVVVENVERWLEQGASARDAARNAMDEVTGPVIAVALVLCAVFVPCAFIGGITGQFFRQFAVTIAVSTAFSAFNSLTLSPALAAILLQPHGARLDVVTRALDFVLGWFFRGFNKVFGVSAEAYTRAVGAILRVTVLALLVYAGLLALTYWEFNRVPSGFVPEQDKGYFMLNVQLPDSASVARTERVMSRVEQIALRTPGVAHTVAVAGQSMILGANAPNLGSMYVMLRPFGERRGAELSAMAIAARLRDESAGKVRGGIVTAFNAPPINGLGTTGGFTIIVQDRGNLGPDELQRVSDAIVARGNATPGLEGLFNSSRVNTPWLNLNIDRTKCMALGVSVSDVFDALQYNFGSYYVNNFNQYGRTWQVNVQADSRFRARVSDLRQLQVRNNIGQMVLLGTLMTVSDTSGPVSVLRYNMYSAAAITGNVAPGTSSGQGIALMNQIADEELPRAMSHDWTDLAYFQLAVGNTALYVFALGVVFVFLVLAAQYESWKLPLAVILVVPMCLLCSVAGVDFAGMDITIFTQIGFVVLVGLASKNAILIVEFAKQRQEAGVPLREAVLQACRLRLRPILMTSFAFILGVVPLVIATGAGAEMRQTLGVAVFSGMIGVTFFGIFLTPVFYYALQWFGPTTTSGPAPVSETGGGPRDRPHQPVHGIQTSPGGAG